MQPTLIFSKALFVLACLALSACGGGEPAASGDASAPRVVVLPSSISVTQGSSVTVQVDVSRLPAGETASQYSINFSEEATRVVIDTGPCPAGLGTPSCRLWTFTPAADSVPGSYSLNEVRAVGTQTRVRAGGFDLTVLPASSPRGAAIVATDVHVITADLRLYTTGVNRGSQNLALNDGGNKTDFEHGRTGVAIRTVGFDPDAPFIAPSEVLGYVRVGADDDRWIDVATGLTSTVAVKGDGTVWTWGRNPNSRLGYDTVDEHQLRPRQVVGLTGATSVSVFSGFKDGDRFLARTREIENGQSVRRVHAWGGRPRELDLPVDQQKGLTVIFNNLKSTAPFVVPQAVSSERVVEPLSNVTEISGATSNSGSGWALALKSDGSVWQFGAAENATGFVHYDERPDSPIAYVAGQAMARQVSGLPSDVGQPQGLAAVRSIAAAAVFAPSSGTDTPEVYEGHGFAVTYDGRVHTWTRSNPSATVVAGLDGVAQVDAAGSQVTVRRTDGAVLTWRLGTNEPPQLVSGLPPIRRLGKGAPKRVIDGTCGNDGALWVLDTTLPQGEQHHRVGNFGSFDFDDPFHLCPSSPGTARLTLNIRGAGAVRVTPGAGLCQQSCFVVVSRDTEVSVDAVPAPGGRVRSMTCSSVAPFNGNSTKLTPRGDSSCDVEFIESGGADAFGPQVTLTVRVSGAAGRVVSIPSGIDCFGECTADFFANASVRLIPVTQLTSSAAIRFVRWQGDDANSDIACSAAAVPLDRSRVCTAVFATEPFVTLTPAAVLNVQITGNGSVSSIPAGIACRGDCTESYSLIGNLAPPAVVLLTPVAAAGYRFNGWSSASNADCHDNRVTMQAGRDCTATFVPDTLPPPPPGWRQYAAELDPNSAVAQRPALALDAGDLPVMAYAEFSATGVSRIALRRYVAAGAGSWQTLGSALGGGANNASQPALVIDRSGNPLVAWTEGDGLRQNIYLARYNVATSEFEAVGDSQLPLNFGINTRARGPSLALDANGLPALAWIEDDRPVFKRFDGTSWVTPAAGAGPAVANAINQIHLAFDRDGAPLLAWLNFVGTGSVSVARADAAAWTLLGAPLAGSEPASQPVLRDLGLSVGVGGLPIVAWVQGGSDGWAAYARQWDGMAWQALGPTPALSNTVPFTAFGFAIHDGVQPVIAVLETLPAAATVRWARFATSSWVEGTSYTTVGPSTLAIALPRANGSFSPAFAWASTASPNSTVVEAWRYFP